MDWGALETELNPTPAFPVEAPDGARHWPEIERQVEFRRIMRESAPRVLIFANANAGKRSRIQAQREGILAGVFDMTVLWKRNLIAYVEFKGYDSSGRAGHLSNAQIDFGNRLVELGVPCATFFDPVHAVAWLREIGFPIAEVRRAA